jgi:hypothetical protein
MTGTPTTTEEEPDMSSERVDAIATLLTETGNAHGRYEATELHGAYDVRWATWYAAYAVEHGLGALLGREVTAEQVAAFFTSSNAELEATVPKPDEPWAAYTARRISVELAGPVGPSST